MMDSTIEEVFYPKKKEEEQIEIDLEGIEDLPIFKEEALNIQEQLDLIKKFDGEAEEIEKRIFKLEIPPKKIEVIKPKKIKKVTEKEVHHVQRVLVENPESISKSLQITLFKGLKAISEKISQFFEVPPLETNIARDQFDRISSITEIYSNKTVTTTYTRTSRGKISQIRTEIS